MDVKQEIADLKTNSNKNFNLSIIFAALVLFVYCYFGSYSFFESTFSFEGVEFWKIIYHNTMAFILFFGLGTIFTKFVLKQNLKDIGLKGGNKKFGLYVILLATLIVPVVSILSALFSPLKDYYPLINVNEFGAWWQILIYFVSYALYYVGWEYLFRGIMLKSAISNCGPLGAILLTTLVSAIIHTSIAGFGKLMIETLSALPAGLIFGYIAYKSDSIYYSLYAHALVGILLDVFIIVL